LAGTNGTGLLLNYYFDFEPSAPEPEPSGWWQIFGVVKGKFKPFGAPFYITGGLMNEDSAIRTHAYRSSGPQGGNADAFEFRIWADRFRFVYPLRVDWAEGKLTPAQPCGESADQATPDVCEYKVLPENDRHVEDANSVTFCANPGPSCENPEKVVVNPDSKVELLVAKEETLWDAGAASGPSGIIKKPTDAMNDAGGVAFNRELWLKVRIDGKEGWIHADQDFSAIGLPQKL
jgi:hypothetical protein